MVGAKAVSINFGAFTSFAYTDGTLERLHKL